MALGKTHIAHSLIAVDQMVWALGPLAWHLSITVGFGFGLDGLAPRAAKLAGNDHGQNSH